MRTITVVTGSRADYGIYRPILRRIEADRELRLDLIVTGMHLCAEFGMTVNQIEQDGYEIRDRIQCLLASDTPQAIAQSTALAIQGCAQAYARQRPQILLTLGDRFEMFAAVVAALPMKIPIAHVHGGESTAGAIDESIRHAITKMSHLHFAATEPYRQRIIQLGEAPERVFLSGAPSLDNLRELSPLSPDELEERFGLDLKRPPLLVTFHPVTLEYEQVEEQINELLTALAQSRMPVVFTYPNADTNGRIIIDAIKGFVQQYDQARAVVNLGTEGYFSLMRHAAAMVGNSSSGIIEAASFELPVVNVGNRQLGRVRAGNVIDCSCTASEIMQSIQTAVSPSFRRHLCGMRNPYGDGEASVRILEELKSLALDESLLLKRFHDLPPSDAGCAEDPTANAEGS